MMIRTNKWVLYFSDCCWDCWNQSWWIRSERWSVWRNPNYLGEEKQKGCSTKYWHDPNLELPTFSWKSISLETPTGRRSTVRIPPRPLLWDVSNPKQRYPPNGFTLGKMANSSQTTTTTTTTTARWSINSIHLLLHHNLSRFYQVIQLCHIYLQQQYWTIEYHAK